MPIPQPKPTTGDTSWFVHDRFGMFIHWGLYALPARHGGFSRASRFPEEYRKYFERFNPVDYDPHGSRSGRKRGHEVRGPDHQAPRGLLPLDSAFTDYKVTNTLYGQDLLAPFVEAFRSEGSTSASTTHRSTGTIPTSPSTASIPARLAQCPRTQQGTRRHQVR